MTNDIREQKGTGRDAGIDALRGLAILSMVLSHLARDLLVAPHPLWLRCVSSIAAPLFIMLAGMLVAQTAETRHHPLAYYLKRGGFILATAALIDVALWKLYPFVGFDVLYLMGLAVPLTALFTRLRPAWQTGGLVLWVGLAGLLRNLIGYPPDVALIGLSESPSELAVHAGDIIGQFLVSGWFPVFPWLFFSFLGVRLFQWRQAAPARFAWQMVRVGLPLFVLGMVSGAVIPSPFHTRNGYSELFYPPHAGYVLAASGIVCILFSFADAEVPRRNQPLILLGRCALFLYIVHLALIHWVLSPLAQDLTILPFLFVYAGLMVALTGLAWAVERLKQRAGQHLPAAVRFVLG